VRAGRHEEIRHGESQRKSGLGNRHNSVANGVGSG